MEEQMNEKDVIVMKLLHYFITEKNYNPVILHGAKDEIWLENMNSDYKIVRIVSNYIHNNEQLDFDLFKTTKIVKNIKKRTLNINFEVLSIFTDLGENVELQSKDHIECIYLKDEKDVKKYNFLYKHFPDIDKKLTFTEKGINLFVKITSDINEKNKKEAEQAEEIFKQKKPVITTALIIINVIIFIIGFLFNQGNYLVAKYSTYGPTIRIGQYYRLLTGTFIHIDFFHILFNMYALKVIGEQVESFFGKWKFLFIYLFSAICGSLLSILLSGDIPSIGASGAIFGLFGAMLYFGYNYRVYLGNTIIKQMVPIILINLLIGFMSTGIDNFAHIGGLVGGLLISMAVGLKRKIKFKDNINGIILVVIYLVFLIAMNFFSK